ncbi:MAG: hypothetical protein L6420_02820 [Elusimicrobia bacterium]|nr:hypothetical protein [Elusimicrobiota bacterium]
MNTFKFIALSLFCQVILYSPLYAGDIAQDSVPTEINYQGRLEKDNAPITGPVHITFRIYDAKTGGNLVWPLVWPGDELLVNAVQGIFSASIEPPWSVFSTAEGRYLEVQIESDILSPREPFQSAAFSLVAKRLEDGSNISITSMTAIGNVLVNNDIKIIGASNALYFPDGTFMTTADVGTVVGNLSSIFDAVIMSDSDDNATGDIIFKTGSATERMRLNNDGNVGIGNTPAAGRKLDVDGSLYIGDEGIYDRDDAEVNIMENLGVDGGVITGANSESISIGATNDIIALTSGGSERMRVHSNGFVGIGITAPTSNLHVSGDIVSNGGLRGGNVSIGDYTGDWTGLNNEIRSIDAAHLLLQQTNALNVGIGLDAPTEKLHVHGSVKADYGIIASTAAFLGDVSILGDFVANDPLGSSVELSSTVIYGTLQVTGPIGSDQGYPAYLASTQVFSGENTFLNKLTVSDDMISSARVGAGVIDYDFGAGKYLQIGDNKVEFVNDNALAYIVAGSNADSKIHFYRGASEAARLETQSGNNLAIVVANEAKALINSSDFRIFDSAVYISTGQGTIPAIYVSPTDGNVGMGTTVLDPNWQLTVDGNIRISGSTGNGIIFADGTILTTAGGGSASALSNNDDVLIQSDADNVGGGNIIINAGSVNGIFVNSGGNIGMGTQNPISKLNIRGGDLVLGNPYLASYGSNGVEDLIIAGSLIVDSGIIQRSASPVQFSALTVSGDVFLSTAATAVTGIGTDNALQKLQVAGDINIEAGYGLRINNTAVSTQYLRGNGTKFVSSAILDGDIPSTIVRTSQSISTTLPLAGGGNLSTDRTFTVGGLSSLGTANYVVGVNNGAVGWEYKNIIGTTNEIDIIHAAGTITVGLVDPLIVGKGGTGATSLISGGILYGGGTGAISALNVLTNGQLLIGDNSGAPAAAGLTGTANQVVVTNGAGYITLSLPQDIHSGATPTFTGLDILAGSTVDMNTTGKITNLADPLVDQDAATKIYVDNATGGGTGAWGLSGNNINDSINFLGTTGFGDDLVIKTADSERMRITSAGIIELSNALDIAYGGTGAVTAAGARTNLGLVIGTNIQAWDADLTDLADGTLTGSKVGSGVPAANIAAGTAGIDINGNAATVTNGVYTTGLYANPAWITSLAGSKLTGGLTATINVNDNTGAPCTITVANGLITGTTCP